MRLRWMAPATQDLYSITRYIPRDNPIGAAKWPRPSMTVRKPPQLPASQTQGKQIGTRELVFSPFAVHNGLQRDGRHTRKPAYPACRTGPALTETLLKAPPRPPPSKAKFGRSGSSPPTPIVLRGYAFPLVPSFFMRPLTAVEQVGNLQAIVNRPLAVIRYNSSHHPQSQDVCVMGPDGEITRLISDWQRGAPGAENALFNALYQRLHSLAVQCLQGERRDRAPGATSLVHDCLLYTSRCV